MKKAFLVLILISLLLSVTVLAADVKRGGTLRITSMKQGVLLKNFNPFSPNSNEIAVGGFYETLVYFNPQTGRAMNWLAESFTWSEDLLELTFKLREGVKWSDGEPFTEKDVLFTVGLGKDNRALDVASLWTSGVVDVRSEKPMTVTFTFTSIDTTVIERFSSVFIVPEHIWSKVDDPLTWIGEEIPVGTGPFVYKEGSFSEQSFLVVRNPNYWQIGADGKPLPYIDEVLTMTTTNEQAPLRLARGEFDWAGYFIANIDEVFVKADPEHFKYWLPEGNLVFLNLNNLQWPFDSYNLRAAIASAIDPVEITRIMASGAVPSSIAGIKASYLHLAEEALEEYGIEYDPDYAKYLIERDGYRLNRNGIYEKGGKALSLNLYVPTGWTDWIMGAEEVSRQLKEVGIEAIVTLAAWPSPYRDMMYNGNYELLFGISVTGTSPYSQFDNWVHSKHWAPIGERAGNYYGMRYKNEEIDILLDKYKQLTDPEEQDRIMAEVLKLFLRDLPSVPMFFNPVWFEYNTRNFVGWPSASNPYAEPRPTGMHKMPIMLSIHLR
jgi:peptide/nickel transport system substrate-binding protein